MIDNLFKNNVTLDEEFFQGAERPKHYNSNNNYNNNTNGKASKNQIELYYRLCERKRVHPEKEVEEFSFAKMSNAIKELNKLPDKASENQINKIVELYKEIRDLGIQIENYLPTLTQNFINGLTGGRDGTASELLQKIYEFRKSITHMLPPTDAQIETLASWFLCPDIPFESYKVQKKKQVEGGWMFLSADEFKEEIKEKLTREKASELIGRNQSAYYEWRKTRATENQIKLIQDLEEDLADLYIPRQVEYAVIEGRYTQITTASNRQEYNPTAYNKTPYYQLLQLSFDEAQKWIDRLFYERDSKTEIRTQNGEENIFESEHQDWLEEGRSANDLNSAFDKELLELQDMIFHIEAMLGYKADEEIHNAINDRVFSGGTESEDTLDMIKEFFMSTVTAPLGTEERKEQINRIYGITGENTFASEIMQGLY